MPFSGQEPKENNKGMILAGVGEAAIGTAGVMFLKHQLIDKENQNQLQYKMNQLLKQQAIISRQIQAISQKVDKLCKKDDTSSWNENLLM